MRVVRAFNNNVVLATTEVGHEVILTGRGLGFQARPGQVIDTGKVVKTFVAEGGPETDRLGQLLADIPPEVIAVVSSSLTSTGLGTKATNSSALMVALADHVSFALQRAAEGKVVEYPLKAEVTHLYPQEYAQATELLQALNARVETPLPDAEAVALSMHLVNAGITTGDLSYTYVMTGVIAQMLDVIEHAFDVELDRESVNIGRFVTHLRYLFVRIQQHTQLEADSAHIGQVIRDSYPRELECAQRLAALVEMRLGEPLTGDEIAYLTLHVARVTG